MKKIILFLSITSAYSIGFAQQRFTAGLKAGMSTTQVEGDTYSGFNKIGVEGGATMNAKLKGKWSAQFEIIYIQKGSKHNPNPDMGDFSSYFLQLDYIEVPLLAQYRYKKFTAEAGPAIGYLVREKESNEIMDLTGLDPFNKKEISLNFGLSYNILKNVGVNCRYSNSISSIRDYASGLKRWNDPGERNNVIAFSITYLFGNAKSE